VFGQKAVNLHVSVCRIKGRNAMMKEEQNPSYALSYGSCLTMLTGAAWSMASANLGGRSKRIKLAHDFLAVGAAVNKSVNGLIKREQSV
jgi:hypothetical protein